MGGSHIVVERGILWEGRGYILKGSHTIIVVEKGKGILGGRGIF